jgi:hypothetical protein
LGLIANKNYQINAALEEWLTGAQVLADFSANRYLPVFQRMVKALEAIRDQKPRAFKKMMETLMESLRWVV